MIFSIFIFSLVLQQIKKGMWSLARMISQTVKSGTDGKDAVASVLRLEAGDINDKNHTQDYIGRDIGDGRFRRRRQSRFF